VCDEPKGTICRLGPESYSQCQCESWNVLYDDDSVPYHFADGGDRAVGDRHYMTDVGECQVVLFMSEDFSTLPELCAETAEFELARTAIEPVWAGEGYDWKRASA
jgi:hypothetical protein